jgi:predicted DCC family thiol-disulfide oxidoreductase YuxK
VRWVRAHDAAGRVLARPSQTPGLIQRHGLTRAAVERDAWAVDAGGRTFSGAAAINRVLEELGGPWACLAAVYRLPLPGWVEDRAYRWIADHRHLFRRWGVTPECEQPGVECE